MPLRTYKKSTTYLTPKQDLHYSGFVSPMDEQPKANALIISNSDYQPEVTMWSLIARSYGYAKRIVATSTLAGLIIPVALVASGVGFIYMQFQPELVEQVKEYSGYYDQGTTALVEDNYTAEKLQYISNPGADYFENLSSTVLAQEYKPDTFSLSYRGTMFLSVPALGMKRLPIKANVESSSKDVYNNVLSNALAHFKGTSLPASDAASNIVIYGHSAGGAYRPRPNDVLAAFTFLKDLKVGDEIILEMDGTKYTYKMSRSKIVEPTDISVIIGTPGKETLTLFTCFPPGNNTSRLVVTAIPTSTT